MINMNIVDKSWLRTDFDGTNEYGKSGNDPVGNTNTSGTIAAWVSFDAVFSGNGVWTIFGAGGDDTDQATNFGQMILTLRYNTPTPLVTNKIEMFHRVDGSATLNRVVGDTTISANTPYLITASSSGTAWKLYVNDTLQTLTVIGGSNTGDWFGDLGTVGTRHFSIANAWRDGAWGISQLNGKIDNVSVWSSQLSDAQVTTLYNGGYPLSPTALGLSTDLISHLRMGDSEGGTVTTMRDVISGGVNDFTMENMEDADIISTTYY